MLRKGIRIKPAVSLLDTLFSTIPISAILMMELLNAPRICP